jgi:hypothetical protein
VNTFARFGFVVAYVNDFGVLDPDGQARYVLELSATRPSRETNA